MRYNRKLLRRFGGSVAALERYARDHGLDVMDMHSVYEKADRVVFKDRTGTYRRPVNLHFDTWRSGGVQVAETLRRR